MKLKVEVTFHFHLVTDFQENRKCYSIPAFGRSRIELRNHFQKHLRFHYHACEFQMLQFLGFCSVYGSFVPGLRIFLRCLMVVSRNMKLPHSELLRKSKMQ